jgi:hypothetical protein
LLSEPHCGAKVESARFKTEKTEKNNNKSRNLAAEFEKFSQQRKKERKMKSQLLNI